MTHLESLTKKLHTLLPELTLQAGGKVYYASPITLESVLKAIYPVTRRTYMVDEEGYFYTHSDGECWPVKDDIQWDLCLPLHKQSPLTIEFLDNLLPEPNEE